MSFAVQSAPLNNLNVVLNELHNNLNQASNNKQYSNNNNANRNKDDNLDYSTTYGDNLEQDEVDSLNGLGLRLCHIMDYKQKIKCMTSMHIKL